MIVAGIQAVTEALRSSGNRVERVWVIRGGRGKRLQEVIDLARSLQVPIQFERAARMRGMGRTEQTPRVVARLGAIGTLPLERVTGCGLLLLADGVEDPRNLGALLRTAEAAGAGAVVIPERRSCGLSSTVVETSAGAALHLPVVRVTNSVRALQTLKKAGFWVVGLDLKGRQRLQEIDPTQRLVVVVGSEHRGLRPAVRAACDFLVALPMLGRVQSLNVSVAAGVVLYQIVLERDR
jgi:23S rRNA (guanosine2251-2'-O)-methyltransferase